MADWEGAPMAPVATSIKLASDEPIQKDPSLMTCDRTTAVKSVASECTIHPAMVTGAEAPPMVTVPAVTGIPASTASIS